MTATDTGSSTEGDLDWVKCANRLPVWPEDETEEVLVYSEDCDWGGTSYAVIKTVDFYSHSPDDPEDQIGTDTAREATHWKRLWAPGTRAAPTAANVTLMPPVPVSGPREPEKQEACPNCGSLNVSEVVENSTIDYGVGTSVPIPVTQPVFHCTDCGEGWTDWRGEEARAAAVARYQAAFAAPIQAKLDAAETRLRGYEAWERSVNEALNSGDGSYRP